MRVGELLDRITIERPNTVDGEYGPQPAPWSIVAARIPAQFKDLLPAKSESAKQGIRIAGQPARVRIRYMQGLTSDMRVTLHTDIDQVFEIVGGPSVIGRREWVEMVVNKYSS